MQVNISNEAIKNVGDSMKKIARKAVEVAESTKLYADGKVVAHVDTTHRVVYEVKAHTTIIQLLNMLAEKQRLPKKIVVDDIVYDNITRTCKNFLYYSDETDHGLSLQLILLIKNRPNDIDILNKEVGIIEW